LFKAYCTSYGRNLHTGVFLHWVQGKGDNVTLGRTIEHLFRGPVFRAPDFRIGDNTGVGHECAFTIGKEIRIGSHCRFASYIAIFDSSGHPSDPVARKRGAPPSRDDVRPVNIGDNVWVGTGVIIYPGVTIGDNSIVSAGSVVMSNVPANTVVAGNPARMVRTLAAAVQQDSNSCLLARA
jgi:acetyltransferase-like isoleucine patch superfamily enzyme